MSEEGCACNAAPVLIFACSGAADVGSLSDQTAREMTRQGVGRMFCLAGVGGRVSGIMKSTEAATRILALDGCKLHCARHCLEQAGISGFAHLGLESLGFEKGQSPVTEEAIHVAVQAGVERLNQKGRCA